MIYVIVSALLFGLVHPGSKLLLTSGIALLPFCELYILIRLLAQIPFVLKNNSFRIKTRVQFYTLISIGIVGALLQTMEFLGIAKGMPVPLVTFLVYSHPIWTLGLSFLINREPFRWTSFVRVLIGVCGIGLIVGWGWSANYPWQWFLPPIAAGFLLSLWVCLSNKAQKAGTSSWTVSFYYDLYALCTLIVVGTILPNYSITNTFAWLMQGHHLLAMAAYSLLVGLLPNLLFYRGSRNVTAVSAGLILLLEPIVSASVSKVLWSDALSQLFFLGAAMVLFAALPIENFVELAKGKRLGSKTMSALALMTIFVVLTLPARSYGKTIHVVEIVPPDAADYTTSSELKQIKVASGMALKQAQILFPVCHLTMQKTIGRGNDAKLISTIKKIAKSSIPGRDIIVGLSRSTFARVAAKAASGTDAEGISIGASTTQLQSVNPRFSSVVSTWKTQWRALKAQFRIDNCKAPVGYFDVTDQLGVRFRKSFESSFGKQNSHPLSKFNISDLDHAHCVFVAAMFSRSEPVLAQIIKANKKINVYGNGDWNYFSGELRRIMNSELDNQVVVKSPTGWIPDATPRSKHFTNLIEHKIHERASPVAVYTYDATILAAARLCKGFQIVEASMSKIKKLPLLRDYLRVDSTGHITSKMYIVTFRGKGLN